MPSGLDTKVGSVCCTVAPLRQDLPREESRTRSRRFPTTFRTPRSLGDGPEQSPSRCGPVFSTVDKFQGRFVNSQSVSKSLRFCRFRWFPFGSAMAFAWCLRTPGSGLCLTLVATSTRPDRGKFWSGAWQPRYTKLMGALCKSPCLAVGHSPEGLCSDPARMP